MANERASLKIRGHNVIEFNVSQKSYSSLVLGLLFLFRSHFSLITLRRMNSLIRKHKIDIVHVHNTHFIISPSFLLATWWSKTSVCLTLHNFRLIHPSATLLYKGGKVDSQLKAGKAFYFGKFFKNSYLLTFKLCVNNLIYRNLIKLNGENITLLCVSELVKSMYEKAGFEPDKLAIQKNFLVEGLSEALAPNDSEKKQYLIYLGRLDEEKGIIQFLKTYAKLRIDLPFDIVVCGSGNLRGDLEELKASYNWITSFEHVQGAEKERLIRGATAVLVPSLCFETFGFTIIEGFKFGVPALVSDSVGKNGIVKHCENGLIFNHTAGSILSTIQMIQDNALMHRLKQNIHSEFNETYTEVAGYKRLVNHYQDLIKPIPR